MVVCSLIQNDEHRTATHDSFHNLGPLPVQLIIITTKTTDRGKKKSVEAQRKAAKYEGK